MSIFDERGEIPGFRQLVLERIEIDRHQVDPADILRGHRGQVIAIISTREKAAMIFGCRVLTRPSMISGKPVTSDTSVTVIPPREGFAVPPVDRSRSLPRRGLRRRRQGLSCRTWKEARGVTSWSGHWSVRRVGGLPYRKAGRERQCGRSGAFPIARRGKRPSGPRAIRWCEYR